MLYFLFHYTTLHLESGDYIPSQAYFSSFEVLANRLAAWSREQPKTWNFHLTGPDLLKNLQAKEVPLPKDSGGFYGFQSHEWESPARLSA